MNKQELKKLIQEALNEISPELLMRAKKSAETRNDTRGYRMIKKINASLSSKLPIKFQTTDNKRVLETNIIQITKIEDDTDQGGRSKSEYLDNGIEYKIDIIYSSYNYKILIGYAKKIAKLNAVDSSNVEFDRKSALILTNLINKIYKVNHKATDLPLM